MDIQLKIHDPENTFNGSEKEGKGIIYNLIMKMKFNKFSENCISCNNIEKKISSKFTIEKPTHTCIHTQSQTHFHINERH
jgi:hypothetical protein